MGVFKKTTWQPLISHLFTRHWVVNLESFFTNAINGLLIYLTLMVTNCS